MRDSLMTTPEIADQPESGATRRDEIDTRVGDLAALLFDLRAAQEADLRSLTWIQRSLEGVRTGRSCGDADLLLGEMARLFAESEAAADAATARRRSAVELLLQVIAERRRHQPSQLAVVAA